jgi:integrase
VAARCLWDELDLQSRIWTLPNLRTKNARPHIVHLSDQAIAAVYQRHQFMSERKEALEKWGAHVAQILSLALAEERWGLGRVA